MLLVHDPPSPFRAYNSSVDVVAFLADGANRAYLASDVHLTLALCVKIDNDFVGGVCNMPDFLSFVDDWLAALQRVIVANALNVELVLDGELSPDYRSRPCLVDRWRPLVSTWIPLSDPSDALLSNDAVFGYDRYQVLNPMSLDNAPSFIQPFDLLAALHYGKFRASNYSFQVGFWYFSCCILYWRLVACCFSKKIAPY